jgi:hypothetical protein
MMAPRNARKNKPDFVESQPPQMIFDIKMTSIRTEHINGCNSPRVVQGTVGELFAASMVNGLHEAKAAATSRRC